MRSDRRRRKKKARRRFAITAALLLIIIAAAVVFLLQTGKVKSRIVLEAGQPVPSAEEFIKGKAGSVEVLKGTEGIDSRVPGTYELKFKTGLFTKTAKLVIKDSVPPKAEAKGCKGPAGKTVEPQDLIGPITDETAVRAYFEKALDTKTPGKHSVNVVLEDAGGNKTVIPTFYEAVADTTPPVIHGAKTKTVRVGESISYKSGVTIEDDFDASPVLKIDNDKVNLDVAGTYPVVYTATDFCGNSSSVEVHIRVEEPPTGYAEIENLYKLADQMLPDIVNDGMSEIEKAFAIFSWTRTHVPFVDKDVQHNYVDQAIRGLQGKVGDCYTCCAAAKTLFERAGMECIFIEKPTKTHYWLQVNVDGKWYFMEPTPIWRTTWVCFLGNDADLEWFNKIQGKQYYRFDDRAKYPKTPDKSPAWVELKGGKYTLNIEEVTHQRRYK